MQYNMVLELGWRKAMEITPMEEILRNQVEDGRELK